VSTSRIEAIFWDSDGVLVDTEPLYFETTRSVFADHGVVLAQDDFVRYVLNDSKGAWHLFAENGHGEEVVKKARAERDRRYTELVGQADRVSDRVLDDVLALSEHVAMAIVTSAHRVHFNAIYSGPNGQRLLEAMRFVLVREDYGVSKPEPEPYLKALEMMNEPRDVCLVVEDSRRGVRAAQAAGIECWVVPSVLTLSEEPWHGARVLDSVHDVRELVLEARH
jgi:HAD superfamily hydrolase (TIGR01509 family)